ncbi:hypothetical protein BaRGS_00019750 [Batillaria attramentaria]|uniref:Uncharacterized protein n=1 Tax=Batillaria attramentaria TaxID=370345 RepID=A0ABD0KPT2_9CAEN
MPETTAGLNLFALLVQIVSVFVVPYYSEVGQRHLWDASGKTVNLIWSPVSVTLRQFSMDTDSCRELGLGRSVKSGREGL